MQAYAAVLFISASLHLALAILTLFRRQAFFVYALGILLGIVFFQFGYAMELLASNRDSILFWTGVQYLGIPSLPFFVAAFSLFLSRLHSRKDPYPRWMHVIWLIPLSLTLLRWTNGYHELYARNPQITYWHTATLLRFDYGPLHYVQDTFSLASLVLSAAIMVRFLLKAGRGKACAYLSLLTMNLLPFVGVSIWVFWAPPLDPTPFILCIAGPLFTLGLYRLHLFSLSPVARESIFDALENAVVVLDRHKRVMDVNSAARLLFGSSGTELLGQPVGEIIPDISLSELPLLTSMTAKHQEITLPGAHGTVRHFAVTLRSLPKSRGWTLVFYETTERKELENRLRHLSFHDPLTGLYNRTYFEEEVARMKTGRQSPVGIIVMDLNGLKTANDSLGHKAGDQLLQAAGLAIARSVRKDEVAARTGGDEFLVLLRNCAPEHLEIVLSRLRSHFAAMALESGLPLSVAMGGAIASLPANFSNAMHEADEAMYADKRLFKEGQR